MHYSVSDNLATDCVFCRIANGELPSFKVYEDADYLAFLDKFPRTLGHVQVIPKAHYRWVYDVPEFGRYFEVVRKVLDGGRKALNPKLVHLITIGDEVPHAHVWIVPRFDGDGHGSLIDIHKTINVSDKELQEMAKNIAGKIS
mgnify:CR=1 FL=1